MHTHERPRRRRTREAGTLVGGAISQSGAKGTSWETPPRLGTSGRLPGRIVYRGAACSPYQVTRRTSIHGLSGTEGAQASPFGCISLEKVNGFMLHVAAYAMHSQLLGSDASRSLPCLASQEARVDVDAKAGLAQMVCRCCRAGT